MVSNAFSPSLTGKCAVGFLCASLVLFKTVNAAQDRAAFYAEVDAAQGRFHNVKTTKNTLQEILGDDDIIPKFVKALLKRKKYRRELKREQEVLKTYGPEGINHDASEIAEYETICQLAKIVNYLDNPEKKKIVEKFEQYLKRKCDKVTWFYQVKDPAYRVALSIDEHGNLQRVEKPMLGQYPSVEYVIPLEESDHIKYAQMDKETFWRKVAERKHNDAEAKRIADVAKIFFQESKKRIADAEAKNIADVAEAKRISDPFYCAICWDTAESNTPVKTKCGHVFCKSCLDAALTRRYTCPTCRQKAIPYALVILAQPVEI